MVVISGILDSRQWSRMFCMAAMFTVACIGTSSHAAILLDDTWQDNSRLETNRPTESAFYFGIDNNNSTPQGSVTVEDNTVKHVLDASSTKFWTHFADHANPVQLAVGQTLRASVSFIPRGLYENSSRAFRMGLFFDPSDPHVEADVNDDGGGGSEDPWQDSTGYAVNIPITNFADAGTKPFDIGKRITNNSSLIGSTGAFNYGASGGVGTEFAWVSGTEYTLTMEITRNTASQSTIAMSIADSNGVLSSGSVLDLGATFDGTGNPNAGASNLPGRDSTYATFSHLMFRTSVNTQVADQLDFTNIRVEVVPEPASAVLALLTAIGAALTFRRSK